MIPIETRVAVSRNGTLDPKGSGDSQQLIR
jgi:hypothetical protein